MRAVPGILAIWHDLDDAIVDTYERWLVSEHIPERLAVPGFLEARRYEAVKGSPRFFIPYRAASPQVLTSPEYLARLASPTPLTREVMAGFRNMRRTVCALAYRSPRAALGGCAVAAYAEHPAAVDAAGLLEGAAVLERDPRVLGVQVWRAVPDAATSSEAKLRPGGDRSIEAALIVDVQHERDGAALEETVRSTLRQRMGAEEAPVHVGTYRLLGVWRASDAHS
ncbi:MAG TPA: hypothetical protein VLV56_04600 [Burkholderiales bacterium]|nr:hypothetical protein [Burkholderiales bacterium]